MVTENLWHSMFEIKFELNIICKILRGQKGSITGLKQLCGVKFHFSTLVILKICIHVLAIALPYKHTCINNIMLYK